MAKRIHFYTGEVVDGAKTGGVLVSEDNTSPIESGELRFDLNEVGRPKRVAVKCDEGFYQQNVPITLEGSSAVRWRVAENDNGSPAPWGDWGVGLNLTNVQDSYRVFWIEAHVLDTESVGDDFSAYLKTLENTEALPNVAPQFKAGESPAAVDGLTTKTTATVAFDYDDAELDLVSVLIASGLSADMPADIAFSSASPVWDAGSGKYRVEFTGLPSGAQVYLFVRLQDETHVGVSATTAAAQVLTLANVPPTFAVAPAIGSITTSSAVLSATAADSDGDTVLVKFIVKTNATAPSSGDWAAASTLVSPQALSGLATGTQHYAFVRLDDQNGNVVVSSAVPFSTLSNARPVVGTPTASGVSTAGVTVTANVTDTESDAITQVDIVLSTDGALSDSAVAALFNAGGALVFTCTEAQVEAGRALVATLSAGGWFAYVRARDAGGAGSFSRSATFTVSGTAFDWDFTTGATFDAAKFDIETVSVGTWTDQATPTRKRATTDSAGGLVLSPIANADFATDKIGARFTVAALTDGVQFGVLGVFHGRLRVGNSTTSTPFNPNDWITPGSRAYLLRSGSVYLLSLYSGGQFFNPATLLWSVTPPASGIVLAIGTYVAVELQLRLNGATKETRFIVSNAAGTVTHTTPWVAVSSTVQASSACRFAFAFEPFVNGYDGTVDYSRMYRG